jgi:hypothetical protein
VSGYTRLGCEIWSWEPFIQLSYDARNLWWGLYTSPEARRTVPGLFSGSISTMAEAARMPSDDAIRALDKLLEAEMVEYDLSMRVLRMTLLPDAGEGPSNGNIIRGWWNRFSTLPRCQIRDAHVSTLRWLVDEYWRMSADGVIPEHVEKAWLGTFAHPTRGIPLLPPRKRGVRRLCDSDTSTSTQPGLFDAALSASRRMPPPSGGSDTEGCRTVSTSPVAVEIVLEVSDESGSADLPNSSETLIPETLSKGFGIGTGIGIGTGSGDPDLDPKLPGDPTPRPVVQKRHLVSIPTDAQALPFTPESLVAALSDGLGYRGQVIRETCRAALWTTIRALAAERVDPPEVVALGQWMLRTSEQPIRHQFGAECHPDEVAGLWAAMPTVVLRELGEMRERARVAQAKSAFLADCMREIPFA